MVIELKCSTAKGKRAFFTGGFSSLMKLTSTNKLKFMYFKYEDEILTTYLFFSMLPLLYLLIVYV